MAGVGKGTSVEELVRHDLEFHGDSELARSLLTVHISGVENWRREAL